MSRILEFLASLREVSEARIPVIARIPSLRGERSDRSNLAESPSKPPSLRGASGASDEAISVRILSLNEIASASSKPRNDELDGDSARLLRSRCSLAMTGILNEIASIALLPRNDSDFGTRSKG